VLMDGPILVKTMVGVLRNVMLPNKKNKEISIKFQNRPVDLD